MRNNNIGNFFFLASVVCACAEKRALPTSQTSGSTNAAVVAASTQASSVPMVVWPESLKKEQTIFFEEGALFSGVLADLNGDQQPEALFLPGERFCGASGCLSLQIFARENEQWKEKASLARGVASVPRFSAIEVLESTYGGWRDIALTGQSRALLVWESGNYTLQGGTVEETERRSSLLVQHLRDGVMTKEVALGLWDKGGKNQGMAARVEVKGDAGARWEAVLGPLGAEWQMVSFPRDFAATAAAGVYRVTYWVGELSLEGGSFRFR